MYAYFSGCYLQLETFKQTDYSNKANPDSYWYDSLSVQIDWLIH